MDERDGREVAEKRGLHILGLLGILRSAVSLHLIDKSEVRKHLLDGTNFRVKQELFERIMNVES